MAARSKILGKLMAFAMPGAAVLALAMTQGSEAASAGAVKITCEREDVMVPGWTGPMDVTYEGEASGTLSVKSANVALSLPATSEERKGIVDGKPHSVTGITGAGDIAALMPDLAALDACAAKSVQPEFMGDADMYAIATTSCLGKAQLSAAPVPIHASVSIALVPGETAGPPDVVVEIRRTYQNKSAAPGGKTSIETFPKNCVLVGQ